MRTSLAEIWLDSFFLCELIIEHARSTDSLFTLSEKELLFAREEQQFLKSLTISSTSVKYGTLLSRVESTNSLEM